MPQSLDEVGHGVSAGQVYDAKRSDGRSVRVSSVFFNVSRLGRLKARTWYARCCHHPFRPGSVPVVIETLRLKLNYRLIEAPVPREESPC